MWVGHSPEECLSESPHSTALWVILVVRSSPSENEEELRVGPLEGLKIIEITGIGPGPFCGMMLSDMGAEVLRIDRAGSVDTANDRASGDYLARGRRRTSSSRVISAQLPAVI